MTVAGLLIQRLLVAVFLLEAACTAGLDSSQGAGVAARKTGIADDPGANHLAEAAMRLFSESR